MAQMTAVVLLDLELRPRPPTLLDLELCPRPPRAAGTSPAPPLAVLFDVICAIPLYEPAVAYPIAVALPSS